MYLVIFRSAVRTEATLLSLARKSWARKALAEKALRTKRALQKALIDQRHRITRGFRRVALRSMVNEHL